MFYQNLPVVLRRLCGRTIKWNKSKESFKETMTGWTGSRLFVTQGVMFLNIQLPEVFVGKGVKVRFFLFPFFLNIPLASELNSKATGYTQLGYPKQLFYMSLLSTKWREEAAVE